MDDSTEFDLGAYLERIGHRGEPTLHTIHRAHVTAIPFENLDPLRGIEVSLAPADLQRKLVAERRGGYCFEHNLLLAAALRALGHEVEPMLARVRVGAAPGQLRARTHLVLRVTADGEQWHADVGFGLGTLIDPIPFGEGGAYEQLGWQFRTVRSGPELMLQSRIHGEWVDQYGFVPEPVPMIDIETSNYYANHHAPFAVRPVIARHEPDGTCIALREAEDFGLRGHAGGPHHFTITPNHEEIVPVEPVDVPAVLAREFGLEGFMLGADGRLTTAEQPPPDTAGLAFTGIAITDLAASTAFYERVIGRPPDVQPAENEVMWRLNEHAWVYIVVKPVHAGHGLLTMLVDDLDAALGPMLARGLAPGAVESEPGKFRRVTFRDPDGNTLAIGQPLSADG